MRLRQKRGSAPRPRCLCAQSSHEGEATTSIAEKRFQGPESRTRAPTPRECPTVLPCLRDRNGNAVRSWCRTKAGAVNRHPQTVRDGQPSSETYCRVDMPFIPNCVIDHLGFWASPRCQWEWRRVYSLTSLAPMTLT